MDNDYEGGHLQEKDELDFIDSLPPQQRERALRERRERFLRSVEPKSDSLLDEKNYLDWKYGD